MQNVRVLISGASIAGPAVAYWLARRGFRPTVVERAPSVRRGGQAIDVRGVALCIVEEMGILRAMRAAGTDMRGMSFVDAAGNELMRTTTETLTGGPLDSPDVELLRDDLSEILFQATKSSVEYQFGDSITGLTETDEGVNVTFERGAPRTFDLVIGADGLHSNVRRLAFGEESRFIQHLGIYLSVFTVPNYLGLDRWQTFHRGAEEMIGVYSARNNTELRAMMGFGSPPLDVDYRDIDAQMKILEERFARAGWEAPKLLELMRKAPDFHLDSMAQIHMDRWSVGRTALVGDAAYSSSPMSGQGTSLAIVGAYVLAGELASAGGDYAEGYSRYEAEMRPFVAENQKLPAQAKEGPPPRDIVVRAANAINLRHYPA
ncbi:MAG: FAD-dependent oxidoreductase [Polyangiaceae bacterium]|nr:FAD-dependent oxidoreductase [Polyangiaceae bacterium]